jgi:hypothetical protein
MIYLYYFDLLTVVDFCFTVQSTFVCKIDFVESHNDLCFITIIITVIVIFITLFIENATH